MKLSEIISRQGSALARIERWLEAESDAMARMERARTARTRKKWHDQVVRYNRLRLKAESDFAMYEAREEKLLARRQRKMTPIPTRPREYEYVLKVDYDSARPGKGWRACFFDIRTRKEDGSRANSQELRTLAAHLKMGEVPEGWEFREVRWGRGERDVDIPPRGPGDENNFAQLSPMISQSLRPSEIGEEEVE